ncbi:MAG: peptide-methionine (S)-S-oxide reductase MsrA [Candidatus Kerfeldbacteria bacterium]|nr:peptide-methionine (S)-S-oxide reductase MsrA [Candidatus Kerfeldbacteria bacterium]
MAPPRERATFAGGCFWCTEAIFKALKGVERVRSGYTGGRVERPTYEQVCGGRTGHAEAVEVTFHPSVVSYEQLVEVFFLTHDPTTPNRQGNDIGEQYRSAIFTHAPDQRRTAEATKARLESEHVFDRPIITRIEPAQVLYEAEPYHQNYYAQNPAQAYCQAVISPKLAKFREKFRALLKASP